MVMVTVPPIPVIVMRVMRGQSASMMLMNVNFIRVTREPVTTTSMTIVAPVTTPIQERTVTQVSLPVPTVPILLYSMTY